MTIACPGSRRWVIPSAAQVPSIVASTVEAEPMTNEFHAASRHCGSVSTCSYQRREYALASPLSMPGVKVKKGSALKDRGTIIIKGKTRMVRIVTQRALKAKFQIRANGVA